MAQFVNYTGGGSPGTPQSAVAAYNLQNGGGAAGASGASGLPAYQPVPDSASFLAMLASLQGQPTLQPFMPTAAAPGSPAAAAAGAASGGLTGSAGHTSVGAGGYGANNVPATPDVNNSWIDANTPFNSNGFMAALQAHAAAGIVPGGLPTVNPFANSNPGSPLQRLQWGGFTQTRDPLNPFGGQVGGRVGPYPTGTSPFPTQPPANPNGTTPVPPAGGTPGTTPAQTWSYGDQLLGHGAGIVPQNPVTNTQPGAGPALPQSPWSHLANHLRNPNGTTPVGPANLQPTNV